MSAGFQVSAESQDQVGVLALVVVQECAQPFAHEGFYRAALLGGGVDEAIKAEFVERRGTFRIGRTQQDVHRVTRIDERSRQVVGNLGTAADADHAAGRAKEFTDRVVKRPRVGSAVGEQNNETRMTPEQVVQIQRCRGPLGCNRQRAIGAPGCLHHHHMVGPS